MKEVCTVIITAALLFFVLVMIFGLVMKILKSFKNPESYKEKDDDKNG